MNKDNKTNINLLVLTSLKAHLNIKLSKFLDTLIDTGKEKYQSIVEKVGKVYRKEKLQYYAEMN